MNLVINQGFSNYVIATGGVPPYTYTLITGNFPTGISLDSTTGRIAGTASLAGDFSVGLQATDNKGNTGAVCGYLHVACTNTSITGSFNQTSSISSSTVGYPYTSSVVMNGGSPPCFYTVVAGSLPGGLSLSTSASIGIVSGIPTTAGLFEFSIEGEDSAGCTIQDNYSIFICANLMLDLQ